MERGSFKASVFGGGDPGDLKAYCVTPQLAVFVFLTNSGCIGLILHHRLTVRVGKRERIRSGMYMDILGARPNYSGC